MKEYAIGEVFEIEGKWYKTIKGKRGCAFHNKPECYSFSCLASERTDKEDVCFKAVNPFDVNLERTKFLVKGLDSLSSDDKTKIYEEIKNKMKGE